jgi:AcrR family transcriptional regulator
MDDTTTTAPRRRPGRPENPIPRSELLRVAREQFAVHGFDGVSMAEIAQKAGLQKSSLFHHFPTKGDLYREALQSVLAEAGALFAANNAETGLSWTARLDNIAAGIVRALADPSRARMLLRAFMTPAGNREGGDAMQAALQGVVDFFAQGVAAGAWPAQDFRHLVLTQCGVHLVFFALPEVSGRLLGVPDIFAESVVEARVREVQRHIRALVGVPP